MTTTPAVAPLSAEELDKPVFEAWAREACNMPPNIPLNWDAVWTKAAYEGWQAALIAQARAAQPKREMPSEMKAAIEEAHKTGATSALLPNGSAVFINYGHDYGDNDHLYCTACGGSGHIEDQRARAATVASVEDARDAARYRWLRNEARDCGDPDYSPIVVMMDWTGQMLRGGSEDDGMRSDEDLDDAVDAAMSATQEGK